MESDACFPDTLSSGKKGVRRQLELPEPEAAEAADIPVQPDSVNCPRKADPDRFWLEL